MQDIKRHWSLVGLIALVLASSCTFAKISGRGAKPLLLNNPTREVEVIATLNESKLVTFDYTGAFDISEVVSEAVARANGDAVINASVAIKGDIGTFFANLFTLGLANARRFEVRGEIVRYR